MCALRAAGGRLGSVDHGSAQPQGPAARRRFADRGDLASTTVSNFTLNGFKENVNGISNDVSVIRDNQAELRPDRKQQIQAANQKFESAVTSSLQSLGTSLSLANAQDKLKTAGQQLVNTYRATLAPVDCSGVDISG